MTYRLDGKYKWLDAWVGLDASAAKGSVVFKVFCDDELAFDSGGFSDTSHPPTGASRFNRNRAVACRVPLAGVRQLRLTVTGTSGEAADWAEAKLWTGSIPLPDGSRFGPADGIARTPPMGYCTWNSFIFDFDEKVIRELADAMVSSGMRDAGYEYLMVDEPGFRTRDKNGNLVPDPKKYPSGIKALGDYLHAKGLKFGIYTDAKSVTCGGFLGSYGHFERDARLFVSWGVDYVKADWNDAPDPEPAPKVYADLAAALRATGRPIYFAVIHWGMGSHHWARKAGSHTWRTTFDVLNAWDTPADCNTGVGCLKAADQTEALGAFAGPGGWNDPDMLTVGMQQQEKKYQGTYNGKQLPIKTEVEDRSHFSLWCLLNAPLLAGNDLRTMPAGVRDILTNREMIALNQDPLGIPAWRAQKMGDLEVWKKPLKNGDIAVGLFNRSDKPQRMTASWRYLDISGKWKARDLWAHKDLGEFEGGYSCEPAGHEMVVLRLSRIRLQRALQPSDSAISGVLTPGASSGWVMGPFVKLGKPVLSPNPEARFQCPILGKEVRWEEQNVYNPAAVVRAGKVYLLYRADDKNPALKWGRTCRIGLACSVDGINFTRHPTPVLYPDNDPWKQYEWEGGCEDLHIIEDEDGTYYMNYTTWSGSRDTMSVATSRDLIHWTKRGPAFRKRTPENVGGRSGVVISRLVADRLIAAKINGKYWMYYTHPSALAWSDNLIDWTRAGKSVWGGGHEAGAIALLRNKEILLMFNTHGWGNGWTLGQALIDGHDLTTILKCQDKPFLYPELEWEKRGFTEPALVANTLVPFKGQWLLYYGAADRHIGLAICRSETCNGNTNVLSAGPGATTIHWRPAAPGVSGDPTPFFWK